MRGTEGHEKAKRHFANFKPLHCPKSDLCLALTPAFGYTFLLNNFLPAKSVPPVTKRIELIGSGTTVAT